MRLTAAQESLLHRLRQLRGDWQRVWSGELRSARALEKKGLAKVELDEGCWMASVTAAGKVGSVASERRRKRISLVLGNVEYRLTMKELRAALAKSGLVVERECAAHGRSCWDARCDVRGE